MSAHTPGPWHWVVIDSSMATLGVGQDPGMGDPHVLSVSPCKSCVERGYEWKWGRCLTPNKADADLIAAAPELLAALTNLEIGADLPADCPTLADLRAAARDAIAKATGAAA